MTLLQVQAVYQQPTFVRPADRFPIIDMHHKCIWVVLASCLVGGSGEFGRTQMLPVLLFSLTDVACAATLLGKDKPPDNSETANTNFSGFISAIYLQTQQIGR
jgi:hypothetical protein